MRISVLHLLAVAAASFFQRWALSVPLIIIFFAALGLGVGLTSQYGPQTRKVYRIIQYRHQL